MSDSPKPEIGSITWTDLTISNAEEVRNFYSEVVGWKHSPVDMGGYCDFNMLTPFGDNGVAGICHARGVNEGLPPQWLIYITVEIFRRVLRVVLRWVERFLFSRRTWEAMERIA